MDDSPYSKRFGPVGGVPPHKIRDTLPQPKKSWGKPDNTPSKFQKPSNVSGDLRWTCSATITSNGTVRGIIGCLCESCTRWRAERRSP